MSTSNKGPGVNPLLQNLTNALYLNQAGDVAVRTGFAGNIVISGNVNIPGVVTVDSSPENPNHVHLSEVGTSGILTNPWLPIAGNVTIDGNANVAVIGNVSGITTLPAVTGNVRVWGNVSIDQLPALGNVSITALPAITGNVSITQMPGVAITSLPEVEIKNDAGNAIPVTGNVTARITDVISVIVNANPITGFYSFNNFGVNNNRGWTMQNTEIPMFAVRVKPSSGKQFRLINYDIGNNNANQSTIGYTWYNAPTITGPAWSWVDIGTTGIQYAIFSDCYGSNTPNGISGGTLNHGGVMIGKTNSQMTPEMADAIFTDGGMTMVCCVRRMDNATKIDVWFAVTMVTL